MTSSLCTKLPHWPNHRFEVTAEKLLMPGVKRLGVLFEAAPGIASAYEDTSDFGVLAREHEATLQRYEIRDLEDVHEAIKKAVHDRIPASHFGASRSSASMRN